MSALLLHLQDTRVALYEGATLLASSPGVAVLGADGAQFGEGALAQLKLRPRWAQTRFWQDVSEQECQSEHGERWSHADLASEHIVRLVAEADPRNKDVVIALSGHYSAEALALMLGVVKSSGLTPVGLVDAAVLECASLADKAPAAHLDIHLNQAIITRLSLGPALKKTGVDILPELGWTQLLEDWSEWYARRFVEETRFDPHHSPEAEQKLLDQLLNQSHPESLESRKISIEAGARSFSLDVSAEAWGEAGRSTFEGLAVALSGLEDVAVSAAASAIPGLVDALSQATALVHLPKNALASAFEHHRDELTTGENRLSVTQALSPLSSEASPKRSVTHLVVAGHAWPIGGGLSLLEGQGGVIVAPYKGSGIRVWRNAQGTHVDPTAESGLEIDGRPITAVQLLEPGMALTLAGCAGTALAIHELSHGA